MSVVVHMVRRGAVLSSDADHLSRGIVAAYEIALVAFLKECSVIAHALLGPGSFPQTCDMLTLFTLKNRVHRAAGRSFYAFVRLTDAGLLHLDVEPKRAAWELNDDLAHALSCAVEIC